jgi:hypothetical protein
MSYTDTDAPKTIPPTADIGVTMDVTLDLRHPMFQTTRGTPDARKIGRALRELGRRFAELGQKEIDKLSGTLVGAHPPNGYTRAGYWVIHTNDTTNEGSK